MSRPLWFVNLLKKAFPARFLLAKIMRRIPPLRQVTDAMLFRGDDIIYLPKDQVIVVNQTLAKPEQTVLPSDVVAHFIEQAADIWIMNRCICRDADNCQDYPVDLGCLFMGAAVRDINPKLGRPVTKDEAFAHVSRARDAGLVHMIGRNRLDTVWLGIGPMEKLLTVCNCCPCCCLWKVLPDMPEEISVKVSGMPGVNVKVTDRCVGCGTCTQEVCFVDAIHLVDGAAVIGVDCRGCGRCVEVCPEQAITLTLEDTAYVEQTVERISNLVSVGSED